MGHDMYTNIINSCGSYKDIHPNSTTMTSQLFKQKYKIKKPRFMATALAFAPLKVLNHTFACDAIVPRILSTSAAETGAC